MQTNYTLKTLEEVITITLNPLKTKVEKLSELEIKLLEKRLNEEFERLQITLVNQVFETPKESKIRIIVNYYHDELITLINEVYKRRQFFPASNRVLYHAYEYMISGLDEVISFIELRFSNYIGLSKNAPVTYLIIAKNELRQKMENLKEKFLNDLPNREFSMLVLDSINQFINTPVELAPVTFKEVLYMKELISQLELLEDPENPSCIYTALTELLVSLNFNNKIFVNFFTENVKAQISVLPSLEEQYQQLAFRRKEFFQMHETPGVCYDPSLPGLKVQVDRWFTHELFYVEEATKRPNLKLNNQSQQTDLRKEHALKIRVMLSGNQVALILRGLEQNRVIIAPTKKAVYEAIVPFLSSKEKEELSPGNTRAKSYDATDHDKQVTVEMLEKLIKSIFEF